MEKVKKIILISIPLSICNFRCSYCYLAQRPEHYQGIQPTMHYTPEQVGYALRKERIGGLAFCNLCADGETMLLKDLDQYVKAIVEQGHYAEVVTNMTITPMLDKFLAWPRELLSKVEFKCSFHYLQLKKHGKLDLFAENIRKAWAAGASANIEITPSDDLIPHIEEIKEFSRKHFGALPHLTIARNDRTEEIEYLTDLPIEEYDRIWSQFGSGFWEFKKSIFGRKQTGFCYAGEWSMYLNLCTGNATQCYCGRNLGNIFETPDEPIPSKPMGRCPIAHCYNGHALLSIGLIPGQDKVGYGDIRNRTKQDGGQWLQPGLLSFFNTHLSESNEEFSRMEKTLFYVNETPYTVHQYLSKMKHKFKAALSK